MVIGIIAKTERTVVGVDMDGESPRSTAQMMGRASQLAWSGKTVSSFTRGGDLSVQGGMEKSQGGMDVVEGHARRSMIHMVHRRVTRMVHRAMIRKTLRTSILIHQGLTRIVQEVTILTVRQIVRNVKDVTSGHGDINQPLRDTQFHIYEKLSHR